MSPPPAFPLHTLRINDHVLATVPGEPTTVAAFQIEQALRDASEVEGVTILGYAGDYSGYFTTDAEYQAQHYEGAMTIYGRHSTRHIRARLVELLTGEAPPPLQEDDITFDIENRINTFRPETIQDMGPPPAGEVYVSVVRQGLHIYIRFFTPPVNVFFASGYFIRLEQIVAGAWQPVEYYGKPFDDQYQDIKIVWRPDSFPGLGSWEIDLTLPAELAQASLRVNLPSRPNFKRLTADIPEQDGVVWSVN